MLLGDGQHATRSAGGIVNGRVAVGKGDLEEFHHEADHLAGGEVLSGLFAALFRKPPEEFLIDVAHLQGLELIRPKIQFPVLVQDRGKTVVLRHLADGGAVVEVFENVVHILGKPVDVGAEIFFQKRMVFLVNFAQRPVGLVGKGRLSRVQFQVLDQPGQLFPRQFRPSGQNFGLLLLPPGDQEALQAADHDDRQNHILVFLRLELAAQPFSGFPDVAGQVVEFGFFEGKGHGLKGLSNFTVTIPVFQPNNRVFCADAQLL